MEFIRQLYSSIDTSKMSWFTFVPEWVIPDLVVLLLGVFTFGFIIRKEKHPIAILSEMFCFIFLYAAVYENMATVMGWYGYGKSFLMIFNVPFSVPLIEALFVYAGLRLTQKMRIPNIARVVLVGVFGTLADLTLDPLSLSQVHGGIGRWSWFIGEMDVNLFGAPVYNYTGWFILCGYAAGFILLGRHWYKKSGYNKAVGLIYPPLCLIGALLVMVSPLSSFLLWLGPLFSKGGATEYLMLGFVFLSLAIVLLAWRGRMSELATFREDYMILVIFGVFYFTNVILDLLSARFDILLFSLPFIAIHAGIFLFAFSKGKPAENKALESGGYQR